MITKDQLLQSILQELNICKDLFAKIPQGYDFNYRPAEYMRSTLELLQYISFASYEFAVAMLCDAFNTNNWKSYTIAEKESTDLKPEEFISAMDIQIEKFKILFDGLSEDELANKEVNPGWSKNKKLGAILTDKALKVAVAYRMQLFLYLKMSCAPELHSGDNWG